MPETRSIFLSASGYKSNTRIHGCEAKYIKRHKSPAMIILRNNLCPVWRVLFKYPHNTLSPTCSFIFRLLGVLDFSAEITDMYDDGIVFRICIVSFHPIP